MNYDTYALKVSELSKNAFNGAEELELLANEISLSLKAFNEMLNNKDLANEIAIVDAKTVAEISSYISLNFKDE